METVQEFRGCENLCYSMILEDTIEKYETGQVKMLAPLAEISKTTETASASKPYDNKIALIIKAEGADTITVSVPALDIATQAEIIGKDVDPETGALMDDGTVKQAYFALGYILNKTDDTKRYVWRYKCSANIPEESSKAKGADTDSSGQSLVITGINTIHKFTKKGKTQKALVVDEADNLADLTTFFTEVTTCDTLKPLTTPTPE